MADFGARTGGSIKWEPMDLDLEVQDSAWFDAIHEVNEWNKRQFSGEPWVRFTSDEIIMALDHYQFRPLVRGLLQQGSPHISMAIHLAPRRAEGIITLLTQSVPIREERVAITISNKETGIVIFAVCGAIPKALERAAAEPLANARRMAKAMLESLGVST